jgi:TatA/E family protein of Tat protein translocase
MTGIMNPIHVAFIAMIALIFLGPKRLPELAKTLGTGMREFRETMNLDGSHESPPAFSPEPHVPVASALTGQVAPVPALTPSAPVPALAPTPFKLAAAGPAVAPVPSLAPLVSIRPLAPVPPLAPPVSILRTPAVAGTPTQPPDAA